MAGPYYVSDATGDDTDTGLSEALAFKTIDKAMNTIAAGEKVWVKADGTYTESPIIDTAGGTVTEIVFEGYTASPGDGGQVTIVGTLLDSIATQCLYCFKNFIFDANSANANCTSLSSYDITWRNCVFKNATADGCVMGYAGCFYECEFLDNTSDGAAVRTGSTFINCGFYRNGGAGIDCDGNLICYNCVFFSQGSQAIDAGPSNERGIVVINCTIDGDGKGTTFGVYTTSAWRNHVVVINTIIYDCATGIQSYSGDRDILVHNLLNSNTANYAGDASGQEAEVTDAPDFVDEVAGADYSLNAASPAKGTGSDYSADEMDMGAIQAAGGGAVGGLLMPNKRGGKQ
jgi:hypothetical protein